MRPDWDTWAMGVARAVAARGDCLRLAVGCVILDESHRIVSTGYNGSPPGGPSCLAGECPRAASDAPRGHDYENCVAVHAEQNALLWSDPSRLAGSTLYCTYRPCATCTRMIRGMGIARVLFDDHAEGRVGTWRFE